MAGSKKQKPKSTSEGVKQSASSTNNPYISFPLSRYASLLGSQTLGLGFTLGMLPRTRVLQPELANLFGTQSEAPKSSQDHPQHPFLDHLTDSPARTLLWLCAGSLVLIAWNAGSLRLWHTTAATDQSNLTPPKADADEKNGAGTGVKPPTVPAKILALKDSLAAVAVASPCAFIILVLFGAPLNSHYLSTAFLSLLLAILTVWTPAFTFGLPNITSHALKDEERRQKWIGLFTEFSAPSPIDRAVAFPAIGAIIGCWLGVVPMPLDWDRPWQAWPLTSAYMAIIGHVVGSGASFAVSLAQFLLIETQMDNKTN